MLDEDVRSTLTSVPGRNYVYSVVEVAYRPRIIIIVHSLWLLVLLYRYLKIKIVGTQCSCNMVLTFESYGLLIGMLFDILTNWSQLEILTFQISC